jgi:hypothetical protein
MHYFQQKHQHSNTTAAGTRSAPVVADCYCLARVVHVGEALQLRLLLSREQQVHPLISNLQQQQQQHRMRT